MTKHHPGSRRPSGHDAPADDPFLEKTISATRWAEENRGTIGLAVLVLVLVVGGIWYYVDSRSAMMESATVRLEELRSQLEFGDAASAVTELTQYVDRFAGTAQAAEGRLVLGQAHLDQGRPSQAITALEPVGRDPDESPLHTQIAFLLAKAYEEADRGADAERVYLAVADAAELNYQIWDALAYAAAIRADRGELEPAAELYRRILASMDEADTSRGLYEMRLAELEARIRG